MRWTIIIIIKLLGRYISHYQYSADYMSEDVPHDQERSETFQEECYVFDFMDKNRLMSIDPIEHVEDISHS